MPAASNQWEFKLTASGIDALHPSVLGGGKKTYPFGRKVRALVEAGTSTISIYIDDEFLRIAFADIFQINGVAPGSATAAANAIVDLFGFDRLAGSKSKTNSAASTNATNLKSTPGHLIALVVFNTNAAVRVLKLYDKATAPTVGTDVPALTVPVPANGIIVFDPASPILFSNGISFATTVENTDAGTTAVGANDLIINLLYR